jgi:2-keto-4-pentenoate hydratase
LDVLSDKPAIIASRFLTARRTASGLAEYPGEVPASLDQAYAVQDEAIAAWNRPILGWKVGRIQPPLSQRFDTDRLAGPIFRVEPHDAAEMPVFDGGFAAGEAEFLLRLGRAPVPGQARFTMDEAADLIDTVHVGIEIASSPLATINRLGALAVISDFGNNNGLVVGPEIPNWRESGFEEWPVVTRIDGKEAGKGRAASFPDGTIGAARFLFELMAMRGIALTAGQWISSGAVGGVHEAKAGQTVEATFGDRFTISCRLKEARPDQA